MYVKTQDFTILHQNKYFINKVDIVELIANDSMYDVVILTECGCTEDVICNMNLNNFSLVTSYCSKFHKVWWCCHICQNQFTYKGTKDNCLCSTGL